MCYCGIAQESNLHPKRNPPKPLRFPDRKITEQPAALTPPESPPTPPPTPAAVVQCEPLGRNPDPAPEPSETEP
jgi:hypothetical protein